VRLLSPLLVLLGLAACSGPRRVDVQVVLPGADGTPTPAPGVALIALPYDRDSVIQALEARAATPRPSTALLDSLFARFRAGYGALAEADAAVRALGDSQAVLAKRLEGLHKDGAEYRQQYTAYTALARSLDTARRRRDAADAARQSARAAFGPAADSVRRALKGWEDSTYRDYEPTTARLAREAGAQPVTDTTRADGHATLSLRPGRWWIFARSWDAADPNAEWYWNVPVQGDSVTLSPTNGRRRPRY
jgi:hypothetical protein